MNEEIEKLEGYLAPLRFIQARAVAAAHGDCTRRKVGAVLVAEHVRTVGYGANGAPADHTSCTEGGCPRGQKSYEEVPAYAPYQQEGSPSFCVAVHAEVNALRMAGPLARGSVCYVTREPCTDCVAALSEGGVAAVYWWPEGSLRLGAQP